MDHTYTRHQLLRMERKVLCALKFNLSYCPPLHFVFLFASIARCSAMVNLNLSGSSSGDRLPRYFKAYSEFFLFVLFCSLGLCHQVVWMARYLLELSLLESQCVVFSPMQLAGAALCLARQVLQEPFTTEGEAAWYLASSVHTGRYVCRVTAVVPMLRLHCVPKLFLFVYLLNQCQSDIMCEVVFVLFYFYYFFSEAVLMKIMHILATAAAKAHTQDTCATFIKFSSPEAMHVSRHPGLKNASGLLGMCTSRLLTKT